MSVIHRGAGQNSRNQLAAAGAALPPEPELELVLVELELVDADALEPDELLELSLDGFEELVDPDPFEPRASVR